MSPPGCQDPNASGGEGTSLPSAFPDCSACTVQDLPCCPLWLLLWMSQSPNSFADILSYGLRFINTTWAPCPLHLRSHSVRFCQQSSCHILRAPSFCICSLWVAVRLRPGLIKSLAHVLFWKISTESNTTFPLNFSSKPTAKRAISKN